MDFILFLSRTKKSELERLYAEAEQFRKTGVMSEDAVIRRLALQYFGKDDTLTLLDICNLVYRELAAECIAIWSLARK